MSSARKVAVWTAALVIVAGNVCYRSAVAAARDGTSRDAGRIAYSTNELTPGSPSGATQYVYSSTPRGENIRLVVGDATDPVWSPDGRWLAYVHRYGEVWRIRADGTGNRRVSRPGWEAYEPTWSPSGKRLTYTRTWTVYDGSNDEDEERYAVYVVRRDGSGTRKLHRGYDSTWSSDGRLIAFSNHRTLAVIGPDGRGLRVIRGNMRLTQLQFAPVGHRLAFVDVPRIRILDVRSGRLQTLPMFPFEVRPQSITWTPDGRRLAYLRDHWVTQGGLPYLDAVELCTMRLDGSNTRRLATLRRETMSLGGLSWAP